MPETSVAESVARQCYGKSADPADQENAGSAEFQAGYTAGQEKGNRTDGWREGEREYWRRGMPEFNTRAYAALEEWRRGFCAGFFTRLEMEQKQTGAVAP